MNDYSDIINHKYTGVQHHSRIPLAERGAIMSAFDALTGLDDELSETARLAEEEVELRSSNSPLWL